MKACPTCGRLFPQDAAFCPVDGQALKNATDVPVVADASDPRVGQLMCGRYQVRRVIADGGMGRVYEALDVQARASVALKVLHPEVAVDEVQLQRFKREFEVSKELPHHHIVDVRDFQPTHDGSYVLAMELLYGEELRATLKREGVIAPARVIRMLSQVAIGLDAAHAKKLVHRDLKPDNIYLCQAADGDTIKILDFGSVRDNTETAKKLTVMGTTIGSPYYMAPEQAQGLDSLDHRADVWALAAIVYEAVTGQVPFNGPNGPSILLQILTKEPAAPSQAGAGKKYPVPPTLDRVMAHGLKKLPALRINSVGELADAVGQAYGLTGNHLDWAVAAQAALAAQIESRLPGLMTPEAPKKPDTVDDFFGESEALGATVASAPPGFVPPTQASAPAGGPAVAPWQQPLASATSEEGLAVAGVPKPGLNWPVMAAVAVAALVLGVVLVLFLR
ncbi:MAG: serine/threonine-protein kinase [Polyangiaceae bacterium]|nr:serine/threonine-protein kinase [Polyangiaceae bacterium]